MKPSEESYVIYVHSCLLWRSPKRFLCQKFSLWGEGLTGRSVSKEYFRKMLSVVTKGQEQMVLAQGVPKELGDETSVLVIMLSDFSLHTLKPEK